MEDIIIEETNYKTFILLLANVFILIAAVSMWVYGSIHSRVQYWLPGFIASLIFFLGFIYNIIKAHKVKPLLTITMDGIIDNSTPGAFGFISYDDIKEFRIIELYGKKLIGVIPRNMKEFIAKLSSVKRRIAKRNLYMNIPPVTINVELAKDMVLEDIYTLLIKRLADYSSLYE
ncbi:MAG: hypothetical protein K0S47_2287 [Herbinix sp.]|nr:hypothetical protein [Herbinix sp.]